MTLIAEMITKEYATPRGPLPVLSGASLTLDAGGRAVIMGPSGSGKSTFLNILGTLERPNGGRLMIDDCDPFALPETELARFRNRRIGFVFQDHHLLPHCNVLENVLVPTLAERQATDPVPRARQLLDSVGLSQRLDHRPAELSGGERQRVAVARAMINRPDVVLADEPTGNLDAASAESVAELLFALQQEDGAILIVVTHSTALAEKFEQRYELKEGKLSAP